MKKFLILGLGLMLTLFNFARPKISVSAQENALNLTSKSYILQDLDSGKVLVESKSDERLPVASIVKLMTILLTLEEIDSGRLSLEDKIVVSENASNMGGSQVFLDANSEYVVGELLKSVIIASANDSSVALAEEIAGSEQLFVKMMNEKARELKLTNTNYVNATGLPALNQYSSARDVAIVLSHVISNPIYQNYSHIWLEDFVHPSGRKTVMTNTNKLSRFYDGCLGGKTGSTNEAKYCLSVGARRDNMSLIAVTLGSETSKDRFDDARTLLNYGFANFENKIVFSDANLSDIKIKMRGQENFATLKCESESNIVSQRGEEINVTLNYNLPDSLTRIKEGDSVGSVDIIINGEKYDSVNLLSAVTIDEPSYLDYLKRIQKDFVA